jgi:hypothetical protein
MTKAIMTRAPSKCIFCGFAGKLTGEHIWSRWMRRYIPKNLAYYRSLSAIDHPDRADFKVFKRPGDIQDWKVVCVCETRCNNGWMRRSIDEPARPVMIPLLNGESSRLTSHEQQIVASWAVLKAMVAEYDIASHVTTHHSQRKYLMKNHLPPPKGWAVWIGHHVRSPTGRFHWGAFPALILPNGVVAKRKSLKATYYNSKISSQLVGKLFIQVMRSPHHRLISSWRFSTPDRGTLFRIWPPSGTSIVWPAKTLSARDVDYAIGAMYAWLKAIDLPR